MKNHTILISVDDEGNLTAEIEGISGSGCDEIQTILDALAEELGEKTAEGNTDDYDRHQTRRPATKAGLSVRGS